MLNTELDTRSFQLIGNRYSVDALTISRLHNNQETNLLGTVQKVALFGHTSASALKLVVS